MYGCVNEPSGAALTQLGRDGSRHDLMRLYGCGAAAAVGDEVYAIGFSSIRQYTALGALPIAGDEYVQGSRDGAPRAAEFGIISAHAVSPGRFALSDTLNHNIRLFQSGMVSTLSGPRPDFRTVDGTATQARISMGNFIYSVATAPDDTIEFIDGFALRKIEPAGVVSTLSTTWETERTDGYPRTVGVTLPSSWVSASRAAGDGGTLIQLQRVDAGVIDRRFEVGTEQGSLISLGDGGLVFLSPSVAFDVVTETAFDAELQSVLNDPNDRVASDDHGGWYLAHQTGEVIHVRTTGATELVANVVAGQALVARDGEGGLWFTDGNTVRHHSAITSTTSTQFELSDTPKAIAYERKGTLVVVVEGALLRLHPR